MWNSRQYYGIKGQKWNAEPEMDVYVSEPNEPFKKQNDDSNSCEDCVNLFWESINRR